MTAEGDSMNDSEKRLKELYASYEEMREGLKGQQLHKSSVLIFPEVIDLIADLVVERLKGER